MPTPQEVYEALDLPDKPPWDESFKEHLPRLQNATSFTEAMAYKEAMDSVAEISQNPGLPSQEFADMFPDWDFQAALAGWDRHTSDKMVFSVMSVFLRQIPAIGIAPSIVDEKFEDFAWARLVCVMAGAGFHWWPKLCDIVRQNYFQFPYGSEDYTTWDDLIGEASRMCGWPCTLAIVEWRMMAKTPTEMTVEHYVPSRVVGMLHILKHAFLSPDGDRVNTYLRGVVLSLPCRQGLSLWDGVGDKGGLCNTLDGGYDKRSKKVPAQCIGVRWATEHMAPRNLIRQRTCDQLPPSVLYGPWSCVVPEPAAIHGFSQHGCKLSGVWAAQEGRISEEAGDTHDILMWGWDNVDSFDPAKLDKKREFESFLPSTYSAESPATLFEIGFPNLEVSTPADKIIFDLPLYADLMRPYVQELRVEFPMIIFLPSKPTPDDSTNQGKSLACLAYARSMVPGIELSRIRDANTGAPQMRADVNKMIESGGTIALDEWRVPKSDGHILSHDNLQSLIVGNTITSGKVGENGGEFKLSHSITASSKCLYFPPDMVSRTFFWFLENLTAEQRERPEHLHDLRCGRTSLAMRLGAWADIETHGLVKKLRDAPKQSGALRFEGLNALLRILCNERGVPFIDAEEALVRMQRRYTRHFQDADDSGLLRHMSSPDSCRISMTDVLDLASDDLQSLSEFLKAESIDGFADVRSVWRALLSVHGLGSRDPYHSLIPKITGDKARPSDKSMTMKLTADIRHRLAEGEYIMHNDMILALHGWLVVRGPDFGGQVRLMVDKASNIDLDLFTKHVS